MTHFLNSRFAFFYLRRDRSQKETDAQGYQNAVQKIGSFDSVEGFFGIYDHLVKPHSLTSESHVTDYHLFREGISPTWEDPKNRNGGKWIVRLRKVEGLASLYWEDLIMALVGEQFGDVGVQVPTRRPVVFTPSTRVVSIREGAGWFLCRFRTASMPRAGSSPSSTRS